MSAKRKLRDDRGFSLAEMLLAVLILLLVSAIVATGVPAARNAYYKVILASNAQSLLSTTVTALRDELGTAWSVKTNGKTIAYFNSDRGSYAQLDLSSDPFKVTEYLTATDLLLDNKTGNERDLLSAAAMDNMTVTCDDAPDYNSATKTLTIPSLTVEKDGVTLASLENLSIRVFSANTESISGYGTADD